MSFYSLRMMTPFGDMTLFEEAGSLCALEWGQGPKGESSDLLRDAKSQLSAYFSGKLQQFDLPLKPHGTEFQKKVWKEMVKIEYGTTLSYGEMARIIGTAPRAVGGACGKNPLPLIIPCHRVVGHRQKLTGYSGGDGIETKRRLLDLEQAVISQ